MRRLLVLCFLALVTVAVAPPPAGAQSSGSEVIHAYDIRVGIEDSGDLLVQETIDYDFGSQSRHGIFRDIPVRYRFDDDYDRVYRLDVVGVTATEGTPSQYEVEDITGAKRIRIGDPDRTVTGRHRYTVTYRIEGALNRFDTHDELYWNAIGADWDVVVERATVEVNAPSTVTQIACYAGAEGSRLPCAASDSSGTSARFSSRQLLPHQAFTVVVGFEAGAVPVPEPILEERWSLAKAFSVNRATVPSMVAVLLAVAGGFLLLTRRVARDRRFVGSHVDVAFGNVTGEEEAVPLLDRFEAPVEYVPPDGLRPGQVGTLVDEHANPLDVTATIVDLAVRGYLRIDETQGEGWFAKPDWNLVRLKPADERLLEYERRLHDSIFDGRDEVALSDLKNTFASDLRKVQDALYRDAVGRKWFRRRPDKVRAAWLGVGVVALLGAIAVTVLAAIFTHWALVPLPLVLGGILLVLASGSMPSRTAAGTGMLRRVDGFRRFIDESEKDRARFAEEKHLFSEYLPYAVVFGATEKWARAFAGLDDEPPPTPWYTGPHAFTVATFSSSMDSFAVTTSGTITSVPASSGSSGFSGGGFSGGGGGGGGGGSW